jgi:hypothetical protein
MKLSDTRLAVTATVLHEERSFLVAVCGLLKEKKTVSEIVEILAVDPERTTQASMEILSLLDYDATKGKPKAERRQALTPMVKEWKLADDDVKYARHWGFNDGEIHREAIDFRDYWLTRPDRRNWSLTWNRRIRDQATRLGKPVPADEMATSGNAGEPKTKEISDAVWRQALGEFKQSGVWHAALGPDPNQPGCRVPANYRR